MMTSTQPGSFSHSLRKVHALLALGERVDGNETEAEAACRAAGRKAQALGLELDDVWQGWGRKADCTAWGWVVDGWFDAAEGRA